MIRLPTDDYGLISVREAMSQLLESIIKASYWTFDKMLYIRDEIMNRISPRSNQYVPVSSIPRPSFDAYDDFDD